MSASKQLKKIVKYLLPLAIAAHAATAQDAPITGEEFREFSEGWTLHFSDPTGEYFGSEQYFEDGSTMWLPRSGDCEQGVWAEDSPRICFLYPTGIACWMVYREGDRLRAVAADDNEADPPLELFMTRRDKRPVVCPDGPSV